MHAEIIAIGSELLIGQVVNSNAAFLSEELNALGISVYFHTVVGDNAERIKDCLRLACSRSDLIICTGGLGPTADDITHETIADYFSLALEEDSELREIIANKFRGRKVPDINFKQARKPRGALSISNPVGTAPGIIMELGKSIIMTFPGVPCEMEAMFRETAIPYLQSKNAQWTIVSSNLRLMGITESQMAQSIEDLAKDDPTANLFNSSNPTLAPYANLGECYLRITAKAKTKAAAEALIIPLRNQLETLFADYVYAYDDDSITSVLAKELRARQLSIAFVESCTGGLLSKMMTDLPGASDYTKVNLVTYSNEAKAQFLNINLDEINEKGAVSLETAEAMLMGFSKISEADINVSVTGIAGPDGATEDKPIGTIYIGIHLSAKVTKTNARFLVEKLDWYARTLTREQVRELAAKKILYRVLKLVKAC